MTTLAIIATLGIAGWIRDERTGGISNAILMGGLAVTFAVVWFRHSMSWAKIVTVILGLLAVASLFFASYAEIFWPVAIILAGGYLLYTAMRPKTA
jgi:Flp pilus assembly protein protease CpaA